MLNFKPQYYSQIICGPQAGSWIALFPAAGAKTDLFQEARREEREQIRQEGGNVIVIGPEGDDNLRCRIRSGVIEIRSMV